MKNSLATYFSSALRSSPDQSLFLLSLVFSGILILSLFFSFFVSNVKIPALTSGQELALRFLPSELKPEHKKLYQSLASPEARKKMKDNVLYVSRLISSSLPDPKEAMRLAEFIVFESELAKVDPLLIVAVIKSESTFNTNALSNQGAVGLMQILPNTAKFISQLAKYGWEGDSRLKDPQYNIQLGIAYLNHLKDSFGNNPEHILIAYNWGPGNLQSALQGGRRVPPSTEKYARKVLADQLTWKKDFVVENG